MRVDNKKNKREVTATKITKTSVVGSPANGDPTNPLLKAANGGDNNMEGIMPDKNIAAEAKAVAEEMAKEVEVSKDKIDVLSASIQTIMEKSEEKVSALSAEVDELKKMAGMTDAMKAYMGGMDDARRKKFMGMTADERTAYMDNMKKSEETVEINGQTMIKSVVGDEVFAMFKAQADQLKDMKKAQDEALEKADKTRLESLAKSDYKGFPGKVEEVAQLIKHVEAMPEDVGAKVFAMMKETCMKTAEASTEIGTSEVTEDNVQAESKLEKMVKEYKTENTCSELDARRAVYATEEGSKLIKEMRS